MDILQLSHYLDNLLDIPSVSDSPNALNGLQVQNTGEIKKIGLAVDLCQATIDLAIEKNCQTLESLILSQMILQPLLHQVATMIRKLLYPNS